MTRNSDWGRIITAMVTPLDGKLSVDYKRAAELARRLVDEGSDAVLVGGTTGESPTLSDNEKVRLFETILDAVGDRAVVLAGTGTNSTEASLRLTRKAEAVGVHGVMLVSPYYNKPPQAGLLEHFRTVASGTRLPVMVYNVPGRTGVTITPETMGLLSEVPNIVALKEAGGSADQAAAMVRACAGRARVYSGDDSLTLPMMAVGAHGVVSVASHVAGPLMAEMIRAFESGDPTRAAELHLRLLPLFKALFVTTNPIPVKTALRLAGFDAGGLRLPLIEATRNEVATIREAMVAAGLEVKD